MALMPLGSRLHVENPSVVGFLFCRLMVSIFSWIVGCAPWRNCERQELGLRRWRSLVHSKSLTSNRWQNPTLRLIGLNRNYAVEPHRRLPSYNKATERPSPLLIRLTSG